MMTMTQVNQAIERSISHDEIVHLPWTAERAAYLSRLSDDEARAVPVHEFWGEEDGETWRVHLDLLPAVEGLRREAAEAGDDAMESACVEVIESDDAAAWHLVTRALDDAAARVDVADMVEDEA